MHLIRNSMDHGIERAEMRRRRGSLPARPFAVGAACGRQCPGGSLGRRRRNRCRRSTGARSRKGLASADADLGGAEILALIFQPGFSTAVKVTEVSGRGVGMDVVRKRVESLRGTIDVASKRGQGTTVTLRLPLTLAIIDGLLVRIEDSMFVLPLADTLECIELKREEIERANGKHVVVVRGEIIPYIRLREYFRMPGKCPELEQIMVVETESGRYGFVVDEVLGRLPNRDQKSRPVLSQCAGNFRSDNSRQRLRGIDSGSGTPRARRCPRRKEQRPRTSRSAGEQTAAIGPVTAGWTTKYGRCRRDESLPAFHSADLDPEARFLPRVASRIGQR